MEKLSGIDKLLLERKCPECGKTFYITDKDEWAYKYKYNSTKWFCSWHCYKAYTERLEKQKQKRDRERCGLQGEIFYALKESDGVIDYTALADRFGITEEQVARNICYLKTKAYISYGNGKWASRPTKCEVYDGEYYI